MKNPVSIFGGILGFLTPPTIAITQFSYTSPIEAGTYIGISTVLGIFVAVTGVRYTNRLLN